MSTYFSEWYAKFVLPPSNETMQSRQETLTSFANSIKNSVKGLAEVMALCRFTFLLPESSPTTREEVIKRMRETFIGADSFFPLRDNELEMRVLAGGVLENILNANGKLTDVAALAISCAPPIEGAQEGCGRMLNDLDESARFHLDWQSNKRRTLLPTSELKVAPTHESVAEALKKIKPIESTNDPAFLVKLHTQIVNTVNAIGKLTGNIDAVNQKILSNQVIFQEELDILWWLFGARSRDLNQAFEEIDNSMLCLVVAKELADLTKILLEHSSTSQFIASALSKGGVDLTKADDSVVHLSEVVSNSSREWREEWKKSSKDVMVPTTIGSLCPTLKAIELSVESDDDQWVGFWKKATSLADDLALTPLALSLQLYRECLLVRTVSQN